MSMTGVFRDRGGVAALVVANINATLPGRVQVDTVEGNPLRVNHLQLGQQIHQICAHRSDSVHQKALGVCILFGGLLYIGILLQKSKLQGKLGKKIGGVSIVAGLGA